MDQEGLEDSIDFHMPTHAYRHLKNGCLAELLTDELALSKVLQKGMTMAQRGPVTFASNT